MNTPDANEKMLKWAATALLVGVVVMQMVALRGLFADGVYFLVYILQNHDFFTHNDKARLFMYWFTQWPTVLAVDLGVQNLTRLTYLFSSWLIIAPILFWALGLWELKNDILFWPFLGLFTIIYFNVNFFIVGEYNLSYALSAFCCALLWRDAPNKNGDLFLLLAAAAILTMTYASTLFMGVLLALLAIPHWRRATTNAARLYWLCLIGIFVIAVGVGVWSYFNPGIPENKTKAMDVGILLQDKQVGFMALCAALLALQFIAPWRKMRVGFFIALLVIESFNLSEVFRPIPERAFSTRAFIGILLFLLCCALSWIKLGIWPRRYLQRRLRSFPVAYVMIPVFMLFAECAYFDIKDSFAYQNYVTDFSGFVNKNSGFIGLGAFRNQTPDDLIYGWCWTYPSMSLLLRHNVNGAILLNGCPEHEPFNSLTALPDFSAYYLASKN